MKGHELVEKNIGLMTVFMVIAISFGGLVEIVPQFFLKETTTPIEGLKPLTAVQLEGRDIYIREGCHVCHTQVVRPLRAEVERYGHYSVAGESVYEHPFLWGSKRTGPDLARVGGKYSDDWHKDHFNEPKAVVPGTVMPAYPWLAQTELDFRHIADDLKVQSKLGVPYTSEMIASAVADVRSQVNADDSGDLVKRYPNAQARDFDNNPRMISEADALIAYLQMLGTHVNFRLYDGKANIR